MAREKEYFIGLDSGSVSLNTVITDRSGKVLREWYDRLKGDPFRTCRSTLERVFSEYPAADLAGVALTGSGGRLLAELLGGFQSNEVLAQSRAIARFHPEVKSVIEMGGEDSKLLLMNRGESAESQLEDFSMNTVCAAGTGSFLDQQAARIGVTIDGEFGNWPGNPSAHPASPGAAVSSPSRT